MRPLLLVHRKTKIINKQYMKKWTDACHQTVRSTRQRSKMQEKIWVVTLDRMAREGPCEEIRSPEQNDGVILHFQMWLASLNLPCFSD